MLSLLSFHTENRKQEGSKSRDSRWGLVTYTPQTKAMKGVPGWYISPGQIFSRRFPPRSHPKWWWKIRELPQNPRNNSGLGIIRQFAQISAWYTYAYCIYILHHIANSLILLMAEIAVMISRVVFFSIPWFLDVSTSVCAGLFCMNWISNWHLIYQIHQV